MIYFLTESDYFKINLIHIQSLQNCISKLSNICNTRGTQSIQTIDKHYNLLDNNI